jgi:hypothetical protein
VGQEELAFSQAGLALLSHRMVVAEAAAHPHFQTTALRLSPLGEVAAVTAPI